VEYAPLDNARITPEAENGQRRGLARANNLVSTPAEFEAEEIVSARGQAKALNEHQYLTPRGGINVPTRVEAAR
jgi:hypothetical protein